MLHLLKRRKPRENGFPVKQDSSHTIPLDYSLDQSVTCRDEEEDEKSSLGSVEIRCTPLHPCDDTARAATSSPEIPNDCEKENKSVSFDHWVTIREYPIILGDNPAVSRGAPLTIDWEHMDERMVALHQQIKRPKRLTMDLKMESLERMRLLKRQGHSREEIASQIQRVNRTRIQRQTTRRLLKFMVLEELCSSIKRGVTLR